VYIKRTMTLGFKLMPPIFILVAVLITTSCSNKPSSIFPNAQSWVNDYEDVISEENETVLSNLFEDYKERTSREILLVTVDAIDPYEDIQEYATDLGNHVGVGTAESNNGLVVVLSTKLRSVGIATGSGTQETLTDPICKMVIDRVMIPHFRNGDYYQGLADGIKFLMDVWEG